MIYSVIFVSNAEKEKKNRFVNVDVFVTRNPWDTNRPWGKQLISRT